MAWQLLVPSETQLHNFLQRFRKEECGPTQLTLGHFQQWCMENSTCDSKQPHKGYVVHREYRIGNDGIVWIQIFLSTVHLLRLVARSHCLQMDATYKLDTDSYPGILCGTSDQDRRFHPAGIGIVPGEMAADYEFVCCSLANGVSSVTGLTFSPDVLVADCAEAIFKGFQDVFSEDTKHVYCWFHVSKAMDKHANQIANQGIRSAIQQDYCEFHYCQNKATFDVAVRLFVRKWCSINDRQVAIYLEYFFSSWINGRKNWHVGVVPGFPATNNGLESTNHSIKDEFTKRTWLPLAHLVRLCIGDLLGTWSKERDPRHPHYKSFTHTLCRSTKLWTESWQWNADTGEVFWRPLGDTARSFYIPAKHSALEYHVRTIDHYDRVVANLTWSHFNDYMQVRNSVWLVTVTAGLCGTGQADWSDGVQWESATCTCPTFFHEYHCKHSLGIAIHNHGAWHQKWLWVNQLENCESLADPKKLHQL